MTACSGRFLGSASCVSPWWLYLLLRGPPALSPFHSGLLSIVVRDGKLVIAMPLQSQPHMPCFGSQATHLNSFKELTLAHTVVKVQIHQHTLEQMHQACQQLETQGHAVLLQVKGKTALFAQKDADRQALQQYCESRLSPGQLDKLEQQRTRSDFVSPPNASEAQSASAQAATAGQLQPAVQAQLQYLKSAGVVGSDELDDRCLR